MTSLRFTFTYALLSALTYKLFALSCSRISAIFVVFKSPLQEINSHSHHHHYHLSVMELGHLLTRSVLTYPEVSSKTCPDSFCQLGTSVSLPWVIYYEAFYLHVLSSFSCIPEICVKLVLYNEYKGV